MQLYVEVGADANSERRQQGRQRVKRSRHDGCRIAGQSQQTFKSSQVDDVEKPPGWWLAGGCALRAPRQPAKSAQLQGGDNELDDSSCYLDTTLTEEPAASDEAFPATRPAAPNNARPKKASTASARNEPVAKDAAEIYEKKELFFAEVCSCRRRSATRALDGQCNKAPDARLMRPAWRPLRRTHYYICCSTMAAMNRVTMSARICSPSQATRVTAPL